MKENFPGSIWYGIEKHEQIENGLWQNDALYK